MTPQNFISSTMNGTVKFEVAQQKMKAQTAILRARNGSVKFAQCNYNYH